MSNGVSVCHMVNAVDDTSMPADLAVAQAGHESITDVGILAWFEADPFKNSDRVTVETVGVSQGDFGINPEWYKRTKAVFSEYDVIHTHHNHSGFYGKLIAKRLGNSIVVTEHNNHGSFTRKGRVANGVTNLIADHVVCVSESVRQSYPWWERTLLSNTDNSVIPNGVNIDRLSEARELEWSIHDEVNVNDDAIVVGSAGMLTEQKAHEVLIEAVDRVNERVDVPIELVISGDGECRPRLEQKIDESQYCDRLHLLGFLEHRDQVYRMMDEIDIYAMPSRWEGFCVAALEAMAMGNACVFSDIPEFETPFGDVALFHEVDNPEDLATKLRMFTEDETREEFASDARNLVTSRYPLEKTCAKYTELYRRVSR